MKMIRCFVLAVSASLALAGCQVKEENTGGPSPVRVRNCFEFLQKVFLGLMYSFSCVLWAIFWSFPLLFFVR